MIEIIFSVILFLSLAGISVIIWKRIPDIALLPETVPASFDWKGALTKIKEGSPFKKVSSEMLLQKMLSKTRVLILKTDNKTSNWLQRLRERAQENKFGDNDTYWKDVRRSTKK
jgi:hypothetical protein